METIWRNGEVAGYLRLGEYGFTINSSIGYGYVSSPNSDVTVSNKYLLEGEYFIESAGVKYKAQIHLKPVFDSGNKRMHGTYWTAMAKSSIIRY